MKKRKPKQSASGLPEIWRRLKKDKAAIISLFVLLAIFWGLFGIAVGCVLLVYGLCSTESFGAPYMAPFSGGGLRRVARAVLRLPLNRTGRRYRELSPRDGEERK